MNIQKKNRKSQANKVKSKRSNKGNPPLPSVSLSGVEDKEGVKPAKRKPVVIYRSSLLPDHGYFIKIDKKNWIKLIVASAGRKTPHMELDHYIGKKPPYIDRKKRVSEKMFAQEMQRHPKLMAQLKEHNAKLYRLKSSIAPGWLEVLLGGIMFGFGILAFLAKRHMRENKKKQAPIKLIKKSKHKKNKSQILKSKS